MARSRADSATFEAIPVGDLERIEAEEQTDEEKAFQDFRNSITAGEEMATVRVSKIPKSGLTGHPMNAKSIYCFAFPVDRYSYEELCEFIRENYGGGLYRLLGTKKGHRGAAFNQLLELMEPIQRKPTGDAQNLAGGGNPSAIMESVANLINQSQERTEALFSRLLSSNPQVAAVNPLASLKEMAELLVTLRGATAPAPQSDLLGELQKLATLKGVLGPLLGVESDGGGRDGAESNFYDLASTALKTVAPVLSHVVASKGMVPGAPAVPALASPANTPPNSPPPPAPPGATNMQLKRQVDILVAQAVSGADPTEVAEMVLDMTPETRLVELHTFLSRPTVIAEMTAVNSAVQTHAEFFGKLRAAILEQLADAPAEPPATPPATA
jgi:hypothetical protein